MSSSIKGFAYIKLYLIELYYAATLLTDDVILFFIGPGVPADNRLLSDLQPVIIETETEIERFVLNENKQKC